MVGKRPEQADLFPRGAAPDAPPRIRKRNGEILFGPDRKRPRDQPRDDPDSDTPLSPNAPVIAHGISLSRKRLTPGMTSLALVIRAHNRSVECLLPSGLRAIAIDDSLIDSSAQRTNQPALDVRRTDDDDDDDNSNDAESASESDNDDEGDDTYANSNPLWSVVSVGQILPVAIVEREAVVQGKKVVTVSLKPELVNVALNPCHLLRGKFPVYAVVRSVEDHGYILSFGSNISNTGFLPFDAAPTPPTRNDKDSAEDNLLTVGTPLNVVTTSDVIRKKKRASATAAIAVSAKQTLVLPTAIDSLESANIQDIRAGMLLRARVMKVGPGGVSLLALGVFPVSVDSSHVPRTSDGTFDVEVDKTVSVRVLFADAALKIIGASMLDCFVNEMTTPVLPPKWKIGTLLKNLRVEAVKPNYGLILRQISPDQDLMDDASDESDGSDFEDFDSNSFSVPVFAHIKHITDGKAPVLEMSYSRGARIKGGARVVAVSKFDGLVKVDLRPSVLSRKALAIDEIEVGELYDCKVMSHTSFFSLMVAVDGDTRLHGTIKMDHLSDVPIPTRRIGKHPSLRIGATLKCRVLSVDLERGHIYLTARKSLISPKYPVLTSVEEAAKALKKSANRRSVYSGTVTHHTSKGGVLVQFCNRICGLVPVQELCMNATPGSVSVSKEEVSEVYPKGDTVHVRVTSVDTQSQKIQLSMNVNPDVATTMFDLGTLVDGEITKADTTSNHFIMVVRKALDTQMKKSAGEDETEDKLKEKNGGVVDIECHIPFGHLSDSPALSDRLVKELRNRLKSSKKSKASSKKPIRLKSAMVLSYLGKTPVVTFKKSLISAFEKGVFPSSFDSVMPYLKQKSEGEKQVLRGYVKALLPNVVIIGFLGTLVGYIRKARIADQFVSDPSRSLNINQSVPCIIESVDDAKERFELSMRPSDVGPEGLAEDTLSLFPSLKEWKTIARGADIEASFPVGTTTSAHLKSTDTFGTVYSLRNGDQVATGVVLDLDHSKPNILSKTDDESSAMERAVLSAKSASNDNSKGEKESHTVRVIDVDPFTGVIDLSRDEKVVSEGHKKGNLVAGKTYKAEVLLVKSSYIILAVRRPKGRMSIAFGITPVVTDALAVRPGTDIVCTALEKPTSDAKRNLVLIDWNAYRGDATGKNARAEGDGGVAGTISLLKTVANHDESAMLGLKIAGKVISSFPGYAHLGIAPGLVGNLHLLNTFHLSEKVINSLPLGPVSDEVAEKFTLPKAGEMINPAFVAGIKNNAEQQGSGPMVVEVALKKERCTPTPLKVGGNVIGMIKTLSSKATNSAKNGEEPSGSTPTIVAIGRNGQISCPDVDCLGVSESAPLSVGAIVTCRVTSIAEDGAWRVKGALSENGMGHDGFFSAIVRSVNLSRGVQVMIPCLARDGKSKSASKGNVDICDISNDFDAVNDILKKLKNGDTVQVRKLSGDGSTKPRESEEVSLTMRAKDGAGDKLIGPSDLDELSSGTEVRGFVRKIGKTGCFVNIGRGVTAYVKLCDLSDDFVKELDVDFPAGKLVSGKIEEVKMDGEERKVSMVLRKRPRKKIIEKFATEGLKEGDVRSGTVKKIDRWGCIVQIAKGVAGILHNSEVDQDRFISDPAEEWAVGQTITVVVIRVSKEKLAFGTKRCYFEASGMSEEQVDDVLETNENAKAAMSQGKQIDTDKMDIEDAEEDEVQHGNDASGTEDTRELEMPLNEESDSEPPAEEADTAAGDLMDVESTVPALKVSQKFDFSEGPSGKVTEPSVEDELVEDIETPVAESKKSSRDKREKKRLREAAEKEIRVREEALARDDNAPETTEDFERLLVGEPNSSVLWIRYMAFCIQMSQLEKGRSIAERALETIALEKEIDRTNVWVAYINMEAQFGGMNDMKGKDDSKDDVKRDAAVFRVFDRACERITDVKNFHLQVAAALRSSHPNVADEVLRRATRKFKDSKKVWIAMGQAQFASGDLKNARRTLDRALMSTEKRQHVPVILKFAQLEFKFGSSERGRTVFESLVGNFPKRADLWGIYLDMETGQCRQSEGEELKMAIERTRKLFERRTQLDLSSKSMKSGFKKWLEFEKTFGGKEEEKEVKNRARAYVEKTVGGR